MAAALARRRVGAGQEGALRPTNLARDLYQIGELVELCFGPRLDSSGRTAIGEMKALGRLGPLLWVLTPFVLLGLGLRGYVWRADNRVVGNVSLYTGGVHPWLGRGWLIANVAVHPDYQRRGIARRLMQAATDLAKRLRGHWVALQVEADNAPALALYQGLGFDTFETVSQWENERAAMLLTAPESGIWAVRRRRLADAPAEMDLIYGRARPGAMAWTQPLEHHEVLGSPLSSLLDMPMSERWVLPDPARPGRLLGSIWIEPPGWRLSRMNLFLDPALDDPQGRQALLRYVLSLPDLEGRYLKIETAAEDSPVEELLNRLRFRKTRSLVQMRYLLDRYSS